MVVFNLHMDYKYPFVEKIGRKTRVKCINDGMNNVNEGAPKFYNILRDKMLQDNSFFTPPHPTQYQKSCSRFKNSTASLSHGFSFFILIHTREMQFKGLPDVILFMYFENENKRMSWID